jgi:hypothetical protein
LPHYANIFASLFFLIVISKPVAANEITEAVKSSGNVSTNSTSLYLKGTIGQPVIQKSNSVSLYIKSGFLQCYMAIDDTRCRPGDANNDDIFNILDVVYLINYKYKGGPPPVPDGFCSGDSNCDCDVNILDAVLLINFIYKYDLPPCGYSSWRNICQ